MRAPRVQAAAIVDPSLKPTLVEQLRSVGHAVDILEHPEDAANYEMVLLTVPDEELPELAEELSARSRRGQIYLHTGLGHGVQVLDPLETTGAVVGAACQISERLWVTEALDELGDTVVSLLIAELGGTAISVPQSQRARLAAALTFTRFQETVRLDATALLTEALGNVEYANEIAMASSAPTPLPGVDGPSGIASQHAAIEEPGVARAFRELVRRTAEQTRADDVELWALQQALQQE